MPVHLSNPFAWLSRSRKDVHVLQKVNFVMKDGVVFRSPVARSP